MKVILFKLDTPRDEYTWFVKDVRIRVFKDLEKIMGFRGTHIYTEIYQIEQGDDLLLVERVKEILFSYSEISKDTIMRFFEKIGKVAEVWNRNQRS